MRTSATPFFRDVRMPSAWKDNYSHERFQLDTMADRLAEEKPRRIDRARAYVRAALRLA